MQSKWFLYEICHSIERYASGYSHLEDRLMWPYYKTSVIDKTFQPMTREEAIELVECERLKVCERGITKGRMAREGLPGVNDLHIVTLGGLDEEGKDASNDLTDVILESSLNIRTNEPSLAFRYSPKINEKTRRLVFENIAIGLGFPSIKHEEKNTKQMIDYYEVAKR
jgi:Pyruvate-formate lyase